MSNENKLDSQIVYLFKSCYYPDFRQKILNLLTLPNGLEQIVEFDSKWIADDITKEPTKFEGKTACVVFLDYSSDLVDFWPLRLCKISKIIPPSGTATYQFVLKVNNYITATSREDFTTKVRDYLLGNQLIKASNGQNWVNKLVFVGDNSILKLSVENPDQQTTWEHTVEYLSKLPSIPRKIDQEQFKNSTFYRLGILTRDNNSPEALNGDAFQLSAGKQYALILAVYHPHFENFEKDLAKEVVVDFSDDLITRVGPSSINLPLRQKKYTKYFDFWTKDRMAGGNSRLSIRVEKDEFNGPYVQIPFKLKAKRLRIGLLFGILASGLFVLGASSQISELAISQGLTFMSEWFVGLLGTVLTISPIGWLQLKEFK